MLFLKPPLTLLGFEPTAQCMKNLHSQQYATCWEYAGRRFTHRLGHSKIPIKETIDHSQFDSVVTGINNFTARELVMFIKEVMDLLAREDNPILKSTVKISDAELSSVASNCTTIPFKHCQSLSFKTGHQLKFSRLYKWCAER